MFFPQCTPTNYKDGRTIHNIVVPQIGGRAENPLNHFPMSQNKTKQSKKRHSCFLVKANMMQYAESKDVERAL